MTQAHSPQATGVVDADALRAVLDDAWERRAELTADEIAATTRPAVDRAIAGLEQGWLRVAEPDGEGGWRVNEWLKKAVLLYFRTQEMALVDASPSPFWDKVPSRFAGYDEAAFRALGARVVPGAVVRAGSHIGKDVVLMPSFVNIGAYVGEGTMVDTWATVGSCAQIGKGCHLSGGAGIGGVLEPLQASPTIIGSLLHWRAFGSGRRLRGRPPQRDRHGRISRPEHARVQPRDRRGQLRLGAAVQRGCQWPVAGEGRFAFAVLRGDRQAGRRAHPQQDVGE